MIQKPLRIEFTNRFNRQRKACPLAIKVAFREALELFLEDSNHPQLRNHRLRKTLSPYRSIDVTGDVRAIFKVTQINGQKNITFHKIGTHKQQYG